MSVAAVEFRTTQCERCRATFRQVRKLGRPRRYCPGCFGTSPPTKRCTRCGQEKDAGEFHRNGATNDALRAHCKPCERIKKRRWRSTNQDQLRSSALRRLYGITLEEYDTLLASQLGRCALCLTDDPRGHGRFHVDHDHTTGLIRGLLCHACNTGLGLFGDDRDRLLTAIDYLDRGRP